MSEVERALRAEFAAEDGSFVLQLRNLHWDKVAFSRLVDAMHTYVRELDPELPLERWAAHGFWFAEDFFRDHPVRRKQWIRAIVSRCVLQSGS